MGIQDKREPQSPRKQDPVSTLQKTGLANYSSFRVRSGLEMGITYGGDHYGAWCMHFGHGDTEPNEQPTNRVILVQACF